MKFNLQQFATKNTDTKVVTGKVRISFVHVFEPHAMEEGQEPKYSLCMLIPKSDKETIAKIKKAMKAAAIAGESVLGKFDVDKAWPNKIKNPLRDGDEELASGDRTGEEYKGCYFVNCSSKNAPGVVDTKLNQIIDSNEIYSGCYGRVSVNFYAFSVSGNKGIACGLNNLQKVADGDYLGGRSRAEDDFDEIEDDDDYEL